MKTSELKITALRLSALPIGIFICACSCALTCRFLLLGAPVPNMAGPWWTDATAIAFIIKLSGGLAVSAAQVFGLAIYTLKRDLFWKWLYIGATAISVIISVLTFQSMIQSGAINAKHNTAEYQAMAAEKERLTEAIAHQRKRKQAIVDKYTSMNWLDYASKKEAEYEKRIMVYENKLSRLQQKLTDYTRSAHTKDFVSASTTYTALGNDVVEFFGLPLWMGIKFSFLLSYAMLIAVALAIDLTGTKLFAFALGEANPKPEKTINTVKESPPQTGVETGAEIDDELGPPFKKYPYNSLNPYERVKREYENIADSYIENIPGANIDGPSGAGSTESGAETGAAFGPDSKIKSGAGGGADSQADSRAEGGAESGAEAGHPPPLSVDIDPELLGRIIEAYGTEKSINAIQNKVWQTGKSSRRREIVLAVGEAYGLRLGNGNGSNRVTA